MDIHESVRDGDLGRLHQIIRSGSAIDEVNKDGITALAYACQTRAVSVAILHALLEAGANPNRAVEAGCKYPIGLAAASGSIPKVEVMLKAGANIRYETKDKYTILVHCIYALNSSDQLVGMIRFLHAHGADLDMASTHGESPLSVASAFGRFDAVKCLLDLGADETALGWNELMKAMIWKTTAEFQAELEQNFDVHFVDRMGRSAWHLAAFGPYLDKAKLLHKLGVDIEAPVRSGDTALMLCAERGNLEMLNWLIKIGANIEAADINGATALMAAANASQTECVRMLLAAGARPSHRDKYGGNAMSLTTDTKILRLLEEAGEDIADLTTDSIRRLLGFEEQDTIHCTVADYQSGCYPCFGKSNPELMDVPFWNAMVRCGCSAYRARVQFDPGDKMKRALWCFDRFGMSFTKLPDGRFVQIGGEHEDYYDCDFYIYNDVIVHDSRGNFRIYGYPDDVFPPTDFHTATLVDDFIYIIGGVGYRGTRRFGETPVYRLNVKNWSIETVVTTGNNPGWIYKHKCRRMGSDKLQIIGGEICQKQKDKEVHLANPSEYQLDLRLLKWTWK